MMRITGFAPDSDPTADGVLTDCTNVVPFEAGFTGAPSAVAANAPALASECRGAVVTTKLDGSRRVFAGTVDHLYELTSATWTDRTRVVSLATPGVPSGTPSTTGGTLAAGTYYAKVVAVDSLGNQTAASVESASVTTTGTTSSIAWTWGAVSGAASYRLYYGTSAGGESAYYTTATNSYTLTATSGTAGTPPATAADVVYTGGAETRWSFCQFGDTTIASNLADTMQASTSGAFADISGAPKAKIVVSASNNFVVAFNTSDATYGVSPDRWWCCAQGDQTSWTPNVATSANTGRLVACDGPIQAALTLGDYIVAYKTKGIFVGLYAGPPVVWQWSLVPGGEAGAVGPEAVCDIGGAHFIVGNDNFWLFDGTRPVPIGVGVVRQWFLKNSSPTFRYRTKASYDRQTSLVSVYYPSLSSSGACDSKLVFHVGVKEWGRADVTVQAPLNFIVPGTTINSMDQVASTINALPNIPVDSQYWAAGGQVASYFNASNQLVSLNGAAGSSSFTTGDLGDDDGVSMIDRLRVRFTSKPTTARATGFYKMEEGASLTQGASSTLNDGKFDLRQSGRFHRIRVDMTGDHKETAFAIGTIKAGAR